MDKTYFTNLRSQDAALFVALFPDQTSGMDRDITVDYLNGLFIGAGGKDLWLVREPVTKKWSVLSKRPEGWSGGYEYFPLRLNYEGVISANVHPLNLGEYVLVKTREDVDLLEGLMADALDSANWNKANFIQVMRKAVETAPHFVCHYGDRYSYSTGGSTYYPNAGKTIRPLLYFKSLVGLPPELKSRASQSERDMVVAYNSLPLHNKPLKYELMFPSELTSTAATLTVGGSTYALKDTQSMFAGCAGLTGLIPTLDLKPVETEKEKNAVTLMHDGLPVWLPPGRFFTRVHKDDFELFCYVFRGVTWGGNEVVTVADLKKYADANSLDFLWLYFDGNRGISYHTKKEPYVHSESPHEFFPFMCNQDGSKNVNVEFYGLSSNRTYFKLARGDRDMANRYMPAIAGMSRDATYFRAESPTSCGYCMEPGSYEILGRKPRRFAEIRVKPEAKPESKPEAETALSLAESMPKGAKVLVSEEYVERFIPEGVVGLSWIDCTRFDTDSLRRVIRVNCGHAPACICRDETGKFFYVTLSRANLGEVAKMTSYIVSEGQWIKASETGATHSFDHAVPPKVSFTAEAFPRQCKALMNLDGVEAFIPKGRSDLEWVDGTLFTASSLSRVIKVENSGRPVYICRTSAGQFFWAESPEAKNCANYDLTEYAGGRWITIPILDSESSWANSMPNYSRYLLHRANLWAFAPGAGIGLRWLHSATVLTAATLAEVFQSNANQPLWICRDNSGEFFYARNESDGCKEFPVATYADGKWTTTNSVVQTPPIQTEGSQFKSLKDMPNKSAVRLFTRNEAAAAVPVGETSLKWNGGQVITQAAVLARCGQLPVTIFRNSDGRFTWSEIGWHSYDGLKYRLQTDGTRRATFKQYLIDEMKQDNYVLVRREDVESFVGEADAEYTFSGSYHVNAETIKSRMDSLKVDQLWIYRNRSGFSFFVKEEELVRNKSRYAIKDGKYVDAQVKWVTEVASAPKAGNSPSSVQTKVPGDSDMALTREDQLFIAQAVAEATKAKAAEQAGPSKVGSALGTAGRGVLNAAAYMTVQPIKEMANPVWQVVRYGFAVTTLLAAIWGAVYTGAVVYQDGLPIRFGRDPEVAKPEAPAAVAPVSQDAETALSEASPSDSQD